MQPNTQDAPGYFVWQAPGKALAVHMRLDVVDRLSNDIQRGFGAVPKRGAEVGGVLLGTIETGGTTILRVDDFEAVTCEYRRGPSFYLSEEEQDTLGSTASRERRGPSGILRAVGYYRSHTRDGAMTLGTEDLDLLERFFPDVSQVAMLVKPFATKVSMAGFFQRENGAFPAETPLEFPFRRREMLGEEAPARRSMTERRPRARDRSEQAPEPETEYPPARPTQFPAQYTPTYPTGRDQPVILDEFVEPLPRPRSAWVLVVLGAVCLAIGAAGGYEAARVLGSGISADAGDFQLDLSAKRNGESLTLEWNRDSAAVLAASRGVLEIEDGDFSKPVQLDAEHLKEGTVIYQNTSPKVRFRLVIYLAGDVVVTQTVDWVK